MWMCLGPYDHIIKHIFSFRTEQDKKHKAKLCSMFDHINQARTKCLVPHNFSHTFLCFGPLHQAWIRAPRDIIVSRPFLNIILTHANTLVHSISLSCHANAINKWCSDADFLLVYFIRSSLMCCSDYFIVFSNANSTVIVVVGVTITLCCHCRIHRHCRCRRHCRHRRSISFLGLFSHSRSLSHTHTLHTSI